MRFNLDIKVMIETTLLILRSIFYKGKPVPPENHILHRENKDEAKKIA